MFLLTILRPVTRVAPEFLIREASRSNSDDNLLRDAEKDDYWSNNQYEVCSLNGRSMLSVPPSVAITDERV